MWVQTDYFSFEFGGNFQFWVFFKSLMKSSEGGNLSKLAKSVPKIISSFNLVLKLFFVTKN